MQLTTGLAIAAAGVAAGAINGVVGSGTLVSFPVLVSLGYAPVVANVTNTVGLVVGNLSATWGYRRELAGQGVLLRRLAPMSLAGGVVGAALLLTLPGSVFDAVVPVLIIAALLLVVAQPRITAALNARRQASATPSTNASSRWAPSPVTGALALGGVFVASIYGGYFGAAQGVIVVAILGVLLTESLQQLNAVKNLLTSLVNGVAALTFVIWAPDRIDWAAAGLIAAGSALGGVLGAAFGRRLPPAVLRACIVVIGSIAVVVLVTT